MGFGSKYFISEGAGGVGRLLGANSALRYEKRFGDKLPARGAKGLVVFTCPGGAWVGSLCYER